jgi:hypothetical protein
LSTSDWSLTAAFPLIEKRLENQRGGYLIHDGAMVLPRVACLIEDLVGLLRGQALIPHVDGQPGQFAQLGCECLRSCRSRALVARHVQGIAYNNSGYGESSRKAGERAQILASLASPLEGEHRLGREPEFVRDRYADAFRSDVEGKKAGWSVLFRHKTPGFQLIAFACAEL